MLTLQIACALLLTSGVIFGGRYIVKRCLHKWRMHRNERFKRELKKAYKRKFQITFAELAAFRRETEAAMKKRVNLVCKNPVIAPAIGSAFR